VEALSAGAVDFVTKPSLARGESVEEIKRLLPLKIKAAAEARLGAYRSYGAVEEKPEKLFYPGPPARRVVAIGSSTGGPRALEEVLKGFPADLPAAVLITQHMPPGFTASFSQRLDRLSALKVKEAVDGESIREGEAYIAPGGVHLLVDKNGRTALSSAAPVNYVRPSADVMMQSVAEVYGPAVVGVILTGMGRDGAEGMSRIKEKGGHTVVQSPGSALIASMPKAVINKGAADEVVPLEEVAPAVIRFLKKKNSF